MTTGPSGAAEASSGPPHGPPAASDRPGSPSQGPLPAEVVTVEGPAGPAEPQDAEEEPRPPSGDRDGDRDEDEAAGPAEDARVPATPRAETPPAAAAEALDPGLYAASEQNDYLRSMSSLLGGGEGAIGPLADILAWPEATVGMGLALGLLATGCSSPSDLLSGPGPGLRSVSSLLHGASSTVTSGLVAGTGSALRFVARALGTVEQRTRESICAALRYLAGHLDPRGAPAGPGGG